VGDCFIAFVLGQLTGLEALGCRAMFGGHGLYLGRTLFGIVFAGRAYLKTGPATVRDYERREMRRFHPGGGEALATYFEVPAEVLHDRRRLRDWALDAARCAGGYPASDRTTSRTTKNPKKA
jgi:DNA transformation protein and related proteins